MLFPCVLSCDVHTTAILAHQVKASHRCCYGPVQHVGQPNSFLPQCKDLALLLTHRTFECILFISSIPQSILNCLIPSLKESQTFTRPSSPLHHRPSNTFSSVHILLGKYICRFSFCLPDVFLLKCGTILVQGLIL